MNHHVDFDGTLRKYLMNIYLKLINFWSQFNASWPTQMIKLCLHKNGNDSDRFTDMKLKLVRL